jgi:hypothetical protein
MASTGMDTAEALQVALAAGARLLIGRVRSITPARVGTRSQTTAYEVEVQRIVEGDDLPAPLVVKHFGPPLLAAGELYDMAVRPSQRHRPAWEIAYAAPSSTSDLAQAAEAFRSQAQTALGQPG